MKVIVTIPAYNEEETIASVIREIPRLIPGVGIVEVLVVDDGSADRTSDVAHAAGADHVVRNRANRAWRTRSSAASTKLWPEAPTSSSTRTRTTTTTRRASQT